MTGEQTRHRPAARFHIVHCTYEPNIAFLREQLDSIKRQTLGDWTCDIRDDQSSADHRAEIEAMIEGDPRFLLRVNPERLGVFHNFEAGVAAAPQTAQFIAYCDQDDIWAPNKLEVLTGAFADPEVMLAHSDMALIGADGAVTHPSGFAFENRYLGDLSVQQLLLRNAVTGCCAAFRASLRTDLLPFPNQGHDVQFHHDLWTAIIAAQVGRIQTIRQPLLLYRQHDANVVGAETGHAASGRAPPLATRTEAWLAHWRRLERLIAEILSRPTRATPSGQRARQELQNWVRHEPIHLRLWLRALTLSVLRKPAGRSARQAVVGKMLRYRPRVLTSLRAIGARWAGFSRRLGILTSAGWRFARNGKFRAQVYAALNRHDVGPAESRAPGGRANAPAGDNPVLADLTAIERSYSPPLPLSFSAPAPRVVIVVPSARPQHVFGGVATAIKFAVSLLKAKAPVRILAIDEPMNAEDAAWLRAFAANSAGAAEADLAHLEIASTAGGRAPAHRGDIFLATIWWSARRIHATIDALHFDQREFYYLIQDYEPGFYPWSDEYALAASTYKLPCRPIVNTKFLARYLTEQTGLRVPDHLVFMPAIDWDVFQPPSAEDIRSRTKRRIFFYGRPGTPRNLFGVAVTALRTFTTKAGLDADTIEVISAGQNHQPIDLGGGIFMRSAGKMSMPDYAETLRGCDIGLSLMLSPHPSYPPFEMAASGLLVVTNEFDGKQMRFTPNLIPTDPSPEAIADALLDAFTRAGDADARRNGARFDLGDLGRPISDVAADVAAEIKPKLSPEGAAQSVQDRDFAIKLNYTIADGADADFSDKRVCLFSHFDIHDRVDPHVLHYLGALKRLGLEIVLVSSSRDIDEASKEALAPLVTAIVLRENAGLDFAGWALALKLFPSLVSARELVLANDSVYGPVHDLASIFSRMESRDFDFWGAAESAEVQRHLQSYFLVFRHSALRSSAFLAFWKDVESLTDRDNVIQSYEIPILSALESAGLWGGALIVPSPTKATPVNPTLANWRRLLAQESFPFLKVQLLRDNPLNNDISGWRTELARHGYDPMLVINHLTRVKPDASALRPEYGSRPKIIGGPDSRDLAGER